MKCPYCRWTGPFRSYGGHMARSHRRIMLRNLKRARSPVAKAKAARTRQEKRRPEEGREGSHGHGSHEARDERGHFCPRCGRAVACPECGRRYD